MAEGADRETGTGGPPPGLPVIEPVTSTEGPTAFRGVFAEHPAGVCVVIWGSRTVTGGLTASSVASVSADPPLLAFSIDRRSTRLLGLRSAEHVTVSFLAAGQESVARLFAARGADPLPTAPLARTPSGASVVAGSRGWIRAAPVSHTEVGGSVLMVMRALECHMAAGRDPLVYWRRRFGTVVEAPVSAGSES